MSASVRLRQVRSYIRLIHVMSGYVSLGRLGHVMSGYFRLGRLVQVTTGYARFGQIRPG